MAPPKMRMWMTWSELTNSSRITKEQFQAQLVKYPKSSILIACTKLSVGFGYGPHACTVPRNMSQIYTFLFSFRPPWFIRSVTGFTTREDFHFSTDNCVTSLPRQCAYSRRITFLKFPKTARRTISSVN